MGSVVGFVLCAIVTMVNLILAAATGSLLFLPFAGLAMIGVAMGWKED